MYSNAGNARSMLRQGIYDGLNVASVSVKYTSAIACTSPDRCCKHVPPSWFQVRATWIVVVAAIAITVKTRDRTAMDSHFVSPRSFARSRRPARYSADDLR